MAIQARMDPKPMVLLANAAPAPSDVIWPNTYLSRSSRMTWSWLITLIILVLTVFWSLLLVPLAGLLKLTTIRAVWPQLADALESHPLSKTLVTSALPTLLVSLLNVAVPYLYYCKFMRTTAYVWLLTTMFAQGLQLSRACCHKAKWRCRSSQRISFSPSSTCSLFSLSSEQPPKPATTSTK